jgi:hypothetical protein
MRRMVNTQVQKTTPTTPLHSKSFSSRQYAKEYYDIPLRDLRLQGFIEPKFEVPRSLVVYPSQYPSAEQLVKMNLKFYHGPVDKC